MTCELCEKKHKTKWYYEDDYFYVCNCDTCNVPMIVAKRHTMKLNQEELIDIGWVLLHTFSSAWFSKDPLTIKLDQNQRKIKDHWHAHLK